jgi:hypothetical protein
MRTGSKTCLFSSFLCFSFRSARVAAAKLLALAGTHVAPAESGSIEIEIGRNKAVQVGQI